VFTKAKSKRKIPMDRALLIIVRYVFSFRYLLTCPQDDRVARSRFYTLLRGPDAVILGAGRTRIQPGDYDEVDGW
jgi:hypothetical protein